jgi:hypothetical protein
MLGLGNSITGGAVIPTPVIGEIAPNRLIIWLKRGEGQTTSSGSLTAWASTSPASVNWAQGRAANQPSISGDEVTFSSSSTDNLAISTGTETFSQFTLMVVINPDESASPSDEYIIGGSDDDMLQIYVGGGVDKLRITMNAADTSLSLSSGLTTGDNDLLLTVTRDTSGNLAVRLNGVEIGTGTSNISDEFDVFSIGSNVGSGEDETYDGQINEVVMYDVQLTGSDLTNAERDIMNRSGIL